MASSLLQDAGLKSLVCNDTQALRTALNDDVGFLVVAEEALHGDDLQPLSAYLMAQPTWSDLPVIVLTHRGGGPDHNPAAARISELLGNVTFLERPFRPITFASVVRTAFKGRQRQFEARARIDELNEGEQRLQTALLAGRLGSWELNLTTNALTMSATCKAVFGRGANEPFTYEDLIASIHPDDRQHMQDSIRSTIETRRDYAIENRCVLPNGTVRWADVRARLVLDRNGAQPRLVGVLSDVTARKTAEESMRLLNETLEERVVERTAQLNTAHTAVMAEIEQRKRTEEQLRQIQKLEMIGQLTGGVAHDFNNLLMAVMGNLELLRKQVALDARAARLVDGAMQGAQRGAALTQRLLAFARKQELDIRPASLTELVRGMANLLERSVGAQVELVLRLPAALPAVLIDANQVELALLNLTVNARDAMPDGGVLTIELDTADADGSGEMAAGRYVRLLVSDTGTGMDAATLAKATEPFFSTKELGKGTGLGLSMIHGLAVQLNGALRLSSEEGRGTTAEIWLPSTTARAQVEETPPPTPVGDTPRATILVVDDDMLISMSTVGMLEDLGHQVIEANSGDHALELLRSSDVDLLITDFSMPKMNGAQLALAARELKPDLPILLASGYAELPPGITLELPRIAKPFLQEQLAQEIAKALRPNEI